MSRRRSSGRTTPASEPVRTPPAEFWGGRAPLVIVPLDGSVEAKAVLPAARLVAHLLQASLHVVHVADEPLSTEVLLARVRLDRAEMRGIVVDQVGGEVAPAVVRLAEEKQAMLIAMTTRGHTGYLGRTVRPVVEQVLSTATCPVLVVRPEIADRVARQTAIRRLLLPLDGAPSSAAVIGPALDLARRAGAEVAVLHVATHVERPGERGALAAPRYVDQSHYEWPAWAREFLSRFGTSLGQFPPQTPMHLYLCCGDPAAEILRFADEHQSDLIVLEWRGRLDPTHAQVVGGVLRDANCPVLLLRTAEPSS